MPSNAPLSESPDSASSAEYKPFPCADRTQDLVEQVVLAYREKQPLRIVGGNSKSFLGRPVTGVPLDTRSHCGIVRYDPVELILTARAGTLLSEIDSALADAGQHLPFEPPHFSPLATLGGCIASGLSGPRRPWSGAVRDFVLGIRYLGQDAKIHRFGGEVMKNVAGYDVSRVMVGAMGTLGVLTEISLKVLPKPIAQTSLSFSLECTQALRHLAEWGRKSLPISGAAWSADRLYIRLEGGRASVFQAQKMLGGSPVDEAFWRDLREQKLDFFSSVDQRPLWRLSLPLQTPPLAIDGDWFFDWAGAQWWLRSDSAAEEIRSSTAQAGGHATCYTPGAAEPFHPLQPALAKVHRQLKHQLDPSGLFNPGRMYGDF